MEPSSSASAIQAGPVSERQKPNVSVIIPTYRSTTTLQRALRALEEQSYPRSDFEVIVVNNDPLDDLGVLGREYPLVRMLVEGRAGSYHARNTGIQAARGEVLAFTDADCIPDPRWLETGVCALRGLASSGMVAGAVEVVFRDGSSPNAIEIYDAICSFPQQEFLECDRFALTANMFTMKSVMDDIGTFDGRLESGGDFEWGRRVFESGLPQYYSRDALVRHPARHTLPAIVCKSLRVTIGTMRTRERARSRDVGLARRIYHHAVVRVVELNRRISCFPARVSATMRLRVVGLYVAIKVLQSVERLRVLAGGAARR